MKFCFKKICINAPFETTQYGHIQQTYMVSEHKDNLYARIFGLVDNNTWFINISFDLLEVTLEQRNIIQDRIRKYYGNDEIHVVTSATHTHYSHNIYDPKYEEFLINTILNAIKDLEYKDYDDVMCSYQIKHTCPVGKSRISGYETNLEYLCLFRMYAGNENIVNIVIHNCHPTTLKATSNFFSAEYPGQLLKMLEDKYGGNFTFLQAPAGDFSSRFVRSGQEYEHMLELANNIFTEVDALLNEEVTLKPFKCIYNEKAIDVIHDCSPVDLSNIRSDLSDRELEVIEYGKIMRANLEKEGNFLKTAVVSSIDLGAVKLIYVPNEIFSEFLNYIDLKEKMLISYSNGDGPYILPIGFSFVTYEMFYDTWSIKSKQELIDTIKNI